MKFQSLQLWRLWNEVFHAVHKNRGAVLPWLWRQHLRLIVAHLRAVRREVRCSSGE